MTRTHDVQPGQDALREKLGTTTRSPCFPAYLIHKHGLVPGILFECSKILVPLAYKVPVVETCFAERYPEDAT